MNFQICIAILSLIITSGCSHQDQKTSISSSTDPASTILPQEGSHYTKLDFKEGSTVLDEDDKAHLRTLAEVAKKDGRSIFDIKILSWADKDYLKDSTGEKVESKDVDLARKRAEAIKEYIANDLNTNEDFDMYNMAKKPNALTKLLQTDDYKVKKSFEEKTSESLSASASEAIVIIEYDEEESEKTNI